ncbi:MAG: hypothetical protein WBA46_01225, partial [Thermomicrobiales bacterium]
MTDTTNAAPTLHVRLRDRLVDVAGDTESQLLEATTYYDVKDTDLDAIEAAMIDAATAPLRAEVKKWEKERDEWRTMSFADRNFAVDLRMELIEAEKKHADLKARADAVRDAAKKLFSISTKNAAMEGDMETWFAYQDVFRNAVQDYDAADRAGETQADEVKDALALLADKKKDTIAEVVADAFKPSDQTADQVIHIMRSINRVSDPTPTDADSNYGEFATISPADQDPALQARPDKARINDLITRVDGASDRLD